MMNRTYYKSVLALFVACGLIGGLSSCRSEAPVATEPSDNLTLMPSPTASPESVDGAIASPEPDPANPATSTAAMVAVTIFKADDQCVNFLPEQVQVAGDRPMEGAVGKVLENQGGGDFDLSGYRVSVDAATGVATVDLRMNPDSDRKLISLSACEQFALFGSLRETLVQNPDWNITDVRFTERGEEIAL